MDFRAPVAQLVSRMIHESEMTRWAIAARMSELADVETSNALLDSYTAESREECNLPFWKALIELATGNRSLVEWHATVLGGRVLWGVDVIDAEIGRRKREMADANAEIKELERIQRLHRGRRRWPTVTAAWSSRPAADRGSAESQQVQRHPAALRKRAGPLSSRRCARSAPPVSAGPSAGRRAERCAAPNPLQAANAIAVSPHQAGAIVGRRLSINDAVEARVTQRCRGAGAARPPA